MSDERKISVRCSERQFEQISAKAEAAGMTVSNYIRQQLFRPTPEAEPDGKDMSEKNRQMTRELIRLESCIEKLSNGSRLKAQMQEEVEAIWHILRS